MLKAVIFDLDDTLLDWSQHSVDWYQHERQHLDRVLAYISQEIGPIESPPAFYDASQRLAQQAWMDAAKELRAPNLGSVLRQALECVGVPAARIDIEACLKAYDWQPLPGVVAYPDAVEVIPMLARHGVKIGLITNAYQPMWMRDRELEAFGLLAHFDPCRLSAADIGYLKPHPFIFEAAMRQLDAFPDEAIFVGDNPEADIAGPQSVGMKAVLRIKPQSTGIGDMIVPDGIIQTLYDLLPLLDTWYPDWRSQKSLNGEGINQT